MRPRLLALVLFILGSAVPAQAQQQAAQPSAPPPEIADTVGLCVSCHGENGVPTQEKVPIIAGQQLFYIMVQLRDYRAERRANEIMSPIAKELKDDQIKALATYFSAQPWPDVPFTATPEERARAMTLEVEGQCSQCHLSNYLGNSQVPKVGGQKADYVEQTLRDFRDGKRLNAPSMAIIVKGWPDPDIAAMSHYLASF